jgi:hypothetical protein
MNICLINFLPIAGKDIPVVAVVSLVGPPALSKRSLLGFQRGSNLFQWFEYSGITPEVYVNWIAEWIQIKCGGLAARTCCIGVRSHYQYWLPVDLGFMRRCNIAGKKK